VVRNENNMNALSQQVMERLDLATVARNTYSQNGEDGILDKILEIEGVTQGFFVEFGAWDGMYLSNTYNLYKRGWHGCYVEGDPERYRDLLRNVPDDRIHKVNAWVQSEGPSSLDAILRGLGKPSVDLLSIDIDGDDLRVWKSLRDSRPLVVIIEYNPTIPSDVRYENPEGCNHGNSALSIHEYASSIGYSLLEGTLTNLIFVRNDSKVLHAVQTKSLVEIALQTDATKYFFGYDGTLITSSRIGGRQINELIPIPWTSPMSFFPQPLPRSLRRHTSARTVGAVRFLYRLLPSVLVHPIESMRLLRRYFARRDRRA
jgi:hypothetical protein